MWTPLPVSPLSTEGRVATSVFPSPVAISAIFPAWSTMPPMSWTSKWRMASRRRPASRTRAKVSGRTSSSSMPSTTRARRASARCRSSASDSGRSSSAKPFTARTRGRRRLMSRSCLEPKILRSTKSIMPASIVPRPGAVSAASGRVDQLEGMLQARVGHRFAPEHPRHLAHALGLREGAHLGGETAGLLPLLHAEMVLGVRGDLGEVGDAEHLALPRHLAKLPADRIRRLAADPHVDLVEPEDTHRIGRRQDHLEGQHRARQLAPRSDPGQGLRLLSGVRREEELHLVHAAWPEPPCPRTHPDVV